MAFHGPLLNTFFTREPWDGVFHTTFAFKPSMCLWCAQRLAVPFHPEGRFLLRSRTHFLQPLQLVESHVVGSGSGGQQLHNWKDFKNLWSINQRWQLISRQLIFEMLPAQTSESIPNSQCACKDKVCLTLLKWVPGALWCSAPKGVSSLEFVELRGWRTCQNFVFRMLVEMLCYIEVKSFCQKPLWLPLLLCWAHIVTVVKEKRFTKFFPQPKNRRLSEKWLYWGEALIQKCNSLSPRQRVGFQLC